MENPNYITDLGSQIKEELGGNYHRAGSQEDSSQDYHKQQDYMKNDDDQDYHKMEEEEEKDEEVDEFEEEDPDYEANEEEGEERSSSSGDDFQPGQERKPRAKKKVKSTIEDAILKAQEEIIDVD